jgi:phage I-like protein
MKRGNTDIAALSVGLISPPWSADYNVQLFPDGEFAAGDGRPGNMEGTACKTWRMDESIARALLAALDKSTVPLVVDYEHQTLAARDSGHPAPAAGWLRSYLYIPDSGLFAKVDWTPRACAYIEGGEYRFISPLFLFDRQTGAVTRLLNAALTNTPALDMMSVAASRLLYLHNPDTEEDMDKLLNRLRAALGLPDTADAEAVCARTLALAASEAALKAEIAKHTDDLAALKAEAEAEAQAKAAAAGAPMDAILGMQRELVALKEQLAAKDQAQAAASVDADIAAALADGRLPRSLEAWARDLGKKDYAALKAYLDGAKPIEALKGMQTDKTGAPAGADAGKGVAALSDEEKYAAEQLGMSFEDYAKLKESK